MNNIDIELVKKAVIKRDKSANKGTFGSLLMICGSYSMAGAGIMAAKGALRCGIGLLKTAVPKSIYPIFASCVLESVYYPVDETPQGTFDKYQAPFLLEKAEESRAVLMGCGMQNNRDTYFIAKSFLEKSHVSVVLDADAINAVSAESELLKTAKVPVILTPHPGEMSRLTGLSIGEIQSNRESVAAEFAKEYGVYLVLKGEGTVVASPDGRALKNTTGNPGMATGGSGDVLAGMIGSLLAQNPQMPFECACAGVYLHGLAGDIASSEKGVVSMLPTDLIECIPKAFLKCNL